MPSSGRLCTSRTQATYPNTGYYAADNIETAFGQGETLVTPIQQAVAYATFANGGTRYQPEVAAAIVNPSGKVLKKFAPKVTGHVSLPSSTYQPMLAGFEGVVNSTAGTANAAFTQYAKFPMNAYDIAGKTGTADVGLNKEPNSWFVGFGPTDYTPGLLNTSSWWSSTTVAMEPRRQRPP